MKRRHQLAAGGTLIALTGLLTVGLEIYDRMEAARIAHIRSDNQVAHECEVRLCKAQGGRWWRGDCRGRSR